MVPLLQLFDFSYPNGLLFYDRSGGLCRRLQDILPGLTLKDATLQQRSMVLASQDMDLFFGVAQAGIQSLEAGQEEFPAIAVTFLQAVTEVFEIARLNEFRFRYVMGKPCASEAEAQNLMWPFVDQETQTRLHSLAEPPNWRAFQAEFVRDNFAIQTRIAIMDLLPHRSVAAGNADPGAQVPHITFHLDVRGLSPIEVAQLDAKAFLRNVIDIRTKEILTKLAPHLTK